MIAYIFSFFLFMVLSVGNTIQCMHRGANNENVEMNFLTTDLHYLTLANEQNLTLANEQRLHLLRQNLQQAPVTFDFTERCILLVSDTKHDENRRLHYQASCLAVKALRSHFETRNGGPVPAIFAIHCAYLKSLIYTNRELPLELKDLPLLVSELNLLLAQARVANNQDEDTVTRRKLFH